mgnify:CR=1 FL=1
MSDKKELPSSEEQKGLNLEDVKNMTIGEAVRKDSELKAGVTESDGVLDKYIKQHRDEVTSQKFEAKLSDFDNLDTKLWTISLRNNVQNWSTAGLLVSLL